MKLMTNKELTKLDKSEKMEESLDPDSLFKRIQE
jgi:hypothetical protein